MPTFNENNWGLEYDGIYAMQQFQHLINRVSRHVAAVI